MRRPISLAFALLLALPAAAADKWWDFYKRGVAAVNARSYEAGADALQRALIEMPSENNAARAKNEIFIYVPHFFLGIAKFNLGDVDGALREWKLSEEQGAIQNTDYYSKLKDWVARAQAEKLRTAKTAATGSRTAAEAAISGAFSSQMQALLAGGDRSDSYRAAQRKLQEARDQFAKAGTDVLAYQKAGETASQAKTLFAAAADDAKKLKAARATAQQQAAAQPTQRQAIPPPASIETPAAQQPAAPQQAAVQPQAQPPVQAQKTEASAVESEAMVDARLAVQAYKGRNATSGNQHRGDHEYQNALRRGMQEAMRMDQQLRATRDDAAAKRIVARIGELDAELSSAVARATARLVESSARNPRPLLESAYRAYAGGDFSTAEVILSQLLTSHPVGEAYLLRGCSRYTRAMLSRRPEPLLAEATRDFKSALKINRGLRLSQGSFSPKLVHFFENVRKSG